jgi:type I restriction enzyme M protein
MAKRKLTRKSSKKISKSPARSRSRAPSRGLPDSWPELIKEAERRGYVEFHNSRIRYKCAQTHEENYNDPEEMVRAGVYSWLIIEKEYPATAIKVEVSIPRRTPSDYADIVVYTDNSCRTPYLVVETKESTISTGEFRQAIEQAFGNANSLRDTQFAMVDSGRRSAIYSVAGFPHDERSDNLLGQRNDLPKAYGAISQFSIIAGDPDHDIKPLSIADTENMVRRAHATIWAGGKRDPLTAFDEWSKLLFAKIYDERHTASGEPRCFQGGRGEQDVATGNRIRELYADAQREDPSIFSEPLYLPDEKIAQVARMIQPIAFTQMDVDSLGTAFESFFGSIFRGELGQYFTRREIVRFVCALLNPDDRDKVLDPAAGSGGFLLETLIQVWHYIDRAYEGQHDQERRKYDFAHNSLYGIEIHEKLGRICQTNLMLHKDGHTNVEVDRSCLDVSFRNSFLDPNVPRFTLIVGNPPFGDTVEEGDRDHLGSNRLSNFELASGNQISSEIIILERAIKWLIPGHGRLGMVVPDGLLNNPGEISRCPAFRRFLFRNTQILAIVSLPDYAFRKSGAQNKTSLLFVRRLSAEEKNRLDRNISQYRGEMEGTSDLTNEDDAIGQVLSNNDYRVFLAEAENIGYTPAGGPSRENDLYQKQDLTVLDPPETILGQYRQFERNPDIYEGAMTPPCLAINASILYIAHSTHRIDPKYHIFKHIEEIAPPEGLSVFTLGEILETREEEIIPYDNPDAEFLTITLTQEGEIKPREAGKGNNPPDWHGAYFKEGQTWYVVHTGGVLISRIDLWKGCISVIPQEFDGAIVTNEFPVYYVRDEHTDNVDVRYLKLLLRTRYFQRAIRAITTGHSNRRRTQESDFENLKVFLPLKDVQERVVAAITRVEEQLVGRKAELSRKLAALDEIMLSHITPERLTSLLDAD